MTSDEQRIWGIVPAAGLGKRMGCDLPKQYLPLAGKPLIEHVLERLLATGLFDAVVVAVAAEDRFFRNLQISADLRIEICTGGRERADSVYNALQFLAARAGDDDWVMVHDAARPLVRSSDVRHLATSLAYDPIGGIFAQPVHDTLKEVENGAVAATIDRTRVWRAQTPQMFRYGLLKQALGEAAVAGYVVTDEASAVERMGLRPRIMEGPLDNLKVTRPEDLPLAAFYLERQ